MARPWQPAGLLNVYRRRRWLEQPRLSLLPQDETLSKVTFKAPSYPSNSPLSSPQGWDNIPMRAQKPNWNADSSYLIEMQGVL